MSDLISKLNVLVRASLNAATSPDKPRRIPAERLGKDIDGEIAALRQHIEDALNSEDAMQTRLNQATAQAEALDRQADAAVLDGDDAQARTLVQQLKRQQQRAAQLDSDLKEHRNATSELIERVNTLEAMVSDARRSNSAPAEPLSPAELREATSAPSDSSADRAPGTLLSNLLRDARERANQSAAPLASAPSSSPTAATTPPPVAPESRSVPITIHRDTPPMPTPPLTPASPAAPSTSIPIKPADAASVDDDLARRRSRLSAPGS